MIWNIVSDSSCDLRMRDYPGGSVLFETVPLRLQVGDREFVDNDDLNIPELLAAMEAEKTASSTACPSPAAFARAFEKGDKTVCFTISSNLSGTYNAAVMGREMALEEHPEKEICVIDSKATAGAMVLLIRKARELMEADPAGERFEEICAQLRLYQAALRTCFTLENFDNLIKNGRMRPLVGTLLHSLGIHVIADATPQGTIHVADKARGEVKTYRAITALMGGSKDCSGAEVVISHCENSVSAMKLRDQILKDLPVKSVEVIPCRGLTSFYAMEKGLIIGY
ncbi:DegV family protein [uncultured Dysosmobacter sp.]|uniref:DegV family protein n=1 Tax=uncultured Dysosmobacter sp. TaxID=2591384 RepID=UPI00260F201E|nr:DegV family protein [uncultured Dysosmobacter sp.]